jgi:hypothetical protein
MSKKGKNCGGVMTEDTMNDFYMVVASDGVTSVSGKFKTFQEAANVAEDKSKRNHNKDYYILKSVGVVATSVNCVVKSFEAEFS